MKRYGAKTNKGASKHHENRSIYVKINWINFLNPTEILKRKTDFQYLCIN